MTQSQGINIKDVNGVMPENTYMINARIDYQFSNETEKALLHGVPLQFITRIKVKERRRWLWDKTITTVTFRYRLQYHPLSGNYLVTNMNDGERLQFQNLSAVLRFLGTLQKYPVISRADIDAVGGKYYGQIRVKLDVQSLPAPLRPLAYISTQWRLASPVYTWSIRP